MPESALRTHLRRQLEARLAELGYYSPRPRRPSTVTPEIVRVNPLRGRVVYGETVLREDLPRRACHERLLFFSQRRTRHRSSILFFIGVSEADQPELEALLKQLEIRSGTRGGHVHVVPIEADGTDERATAPRRPQKTASRLGGARRRSDAPSTGK